METTLLIENNGNIMLPVCVGDINITWERKGTPGRMTFTVLKTEGLDFQEGNAVKFAADGTDMFYGFVFKKSRDRDGTIDVTVYDQLRYLKNKTTFLSDEGLTAAQLLTRLAADFGLNTGEIADTGYTLEIIDEENITLFDMIQDALDETLVNTGELYVLYDDVGKLALKNIADLTVETLITGDTAENFSYTSSIDDETYDKIALYYDNEDTGTREWYEAQDGSHINEWGVLQYTEELDSSTGAAAQAEQLLSLYNAKTRNLTVKNAFGDPAVRAGSTVPVVLSLGDINLQQYMVVETAKHKFSEGVHTMDLTLIGGEFVA